MTSFIKQKREVFEYGTLLVPKDVTSIYSSIPNKEGLRASVQALEKSLEEPAMLSLETY